MINTSASDKCNLALHVKELIKLKILIVRFHIVGLCRNHSLEMVSYIARSKNCIENWSVNGSCCEMKNSQAEEG